MLESKTTYPRAVLLKILEVIATTIPGVLLLASDHLSRVGSEASVSGREGDAPLVLGDVLLDGRVGEALQARRRTQPRTFHAGVGQGQCGNRVPKVRESGTDGHDYGTTGHAVNADA